MEATETVITKAITQRFPVYSNAWCCPVRYEEIKKKDSTSLWELARSGTADPNRILIPQRRKDYGRRVHCEVNPINAIPHFCVAFLNVQMFKDH